MEKVESDYGKGLTYCLGLFLAHAEQFRLDQYQKETEDTVDIRALTWFNASSDHLYELVIPKTLPLNLQLRLEYLKKKCIWWGHGFGSEGEANHDENKQATKESVRWAIDEAKELLRLIDKYNGIKTIKAKFA